MSDSNSISRRAAVLTGLATAGAAALAQAQEGSAAPASLLSQGATVLFQGDSITDAGRKREITEPNIREGLGYGYAFLASAHLRIEGPLLGLKCLNRGISGHKVPQLAARWQADCLDLKPDVLSILIGVNDIWHTLSDAGYKGTVETYRTDYDSLLQRTRAALPGLKLVLCEPFVLKVGAVDDRWFPAFDGYRGAAKELADKYADAWVPFQAVFDEAAKLAPPKVWLPDGVHPSAEGAALMAQAWVRAVEG